MMSRYTLLLCLVALLLTACGGQTAPQAAAEPTAAEREPTTAPANRLSMIDPQIEKARAVPPVLAPVETTAEYRLIEYPLGEARVPLNPQRIVTLEASLTDAVAALGFGDRIVGTVQWQGAFHEHIASLLDPDVLAVGTESEPNLEVIALAQPDLILTWDWYPDPVPQLQQIAPTIVLPYAEYEQRIGQTYSAEQYITWLVREVAAVLGAADRVEPAMQPHRDAVAAARARLEQILGDQTVAFLDVRVDSILLSGYGFDGISALLTGIYASSPTR